jgi:ABC-type nickel/cobalt efflux system permease component RcnA
MIPLNTIAIDNTLSRVSAFIVIFVGRVVVPTVLLHDVVVNPTGLDEHHDAERDHDADEHTHGDQDRLLFGHCAAHRPSM